MKQFIGLAMGTIIGAALGAGAVSELHAQAKSPVYLVAEVSVTNPQGYGKEFVPKINASIKAGGGQVIAVGGGRGKRAQKIVALEGKPPSHVIIHRWESMDALKAWWNGAAAKAARKIGHKYAKFRIFAFKGAASGQ